MKEKLKSRKFWLAILSNIVSITVVFTEVGGTTGTIAGIIGTIASSVFYMITECKVDVARAKTTYDEVLEQVKDLRKGGESSGESNSDDGLS